jgi:hypothetical protein
MTNVVPTPAMMPPPVDALLLAIVLWVTVSEPVVEMPDPTLFSIET